MNKTRLAMVLFVVTEGTFFLMLILGYVRFQHQAQVEAARVLAPGRTFLFSLALFASSATMWRAGIRFGTGSRRGAQWWLLATIALGVTFLVGQAIEWADLLGGGVTVSGGVFGTAFFTLTGFHGLHVTVGLIAIATVLGLSRSGRLRPEHREGLEGVEIYWHFVDAVWVAIFSVVYLGASM